MKRAAWSLLVLIALAALAAPWLAPNPPNRRFDDLLYAPPTPVHIFSDGLHAPFINPWRLVSRLERRFEADASTHVSLRWFTAGTLVTADPDADAPLLFLGADGYGRDIFSRLLYGARATLAVSLVSALLTTILGACIGGLAAYVGGWLDGVLSRVSEFVLVLPAIYVALVLRAVLPLVLPPSTVFVAADRHLHAPRMADRRARCARDRARRARARVRHRGACRRCQRRPHPAPPPAAGIGRVPANAGIVAGAGVHARRGHVVLRWSRISEHDSHVGNNASGCVERGAAR